MKHSVIERGEVPREMRHEWLCGRGPLAGQEMKSGIGDKFV